MSTAYAMTTGFLLILLVMIGINAGRRLKGSNHRNISMMLILTTILYVVMDYVWLACYEAERYNRSLFIAVNFLFYFIYITLPYFWFFFSQHFITDLRQHRIYGFISLFPWLANTLSLVMTLFGADLVFVVGDAGNRYQRGVLFNLFSNINLLYYFVPILQTILFLSRAKNKKLGGEDRRTLWYILGFSLVPALGVFISTYFISEMEIYPFKPFCFFMGVVFGYTVIVNDAQRTQDALRAEAKRQETLANEKLAEARAIARQSDIISSLGEAFVFIGLTDIAEKRTDIIHASPAAARTFLQLAGGGSSFMDLRKQIMGIIYPDDRKAFSEATDEAAILKALREEGAYKVDTRFVLGRDEKYYRIKFTLLNADVNKVVVGLLDIDAQVRHEIELGRMEGYQKAQQFADAFLHSYVSAYYIDLNDYSQIVFHRNEYLSEQYGNIPNYLTSITAYIMADVHEDDREVMLEAVQPDYIRSKLKSQEKYIVYMRDISEPKMRWYRFEVSRGADENHAGLSFVDVTERIEQDAAVQKELEEAREKADAASVAKTNFLFNMSHDIRTPLNAITGFTMMAKKYAADPERTREYLDKIDTSGQQLLALINEVLEMSRIESGKLELNLSEVNIAESYSATVAVFTAQAESKNLTFHHELRHIRHLNVLADVSKMSQITINVTGNAIKYTPPGGSIEFILEEEPSNREGYASYILRVSDTGIGMSPEFLEHLFDPFSREQNSTVSAIQGTGLGMAIVKDIVDFLGGSIRVQSRPGEGTVFETTIDLKVCEASETREKVAETHDTEFLRGKKVLVVEDNELNREITMDVLQDYGMLIEEATDGDIAVEMVRDTIERGEPSYYDLIIMDVQMPHMNGFDATRAIRALPGMRDIHIPIIAMTANAFAEDAKKALAAGMDAHVAKPISIQKLLATLKKLMVDINGN